MWPGAIQLGSAAGAASAPCSRSSKNHQFPAPYRRSDNSQAFLPIQLASSFLLVVRNHEVCCWSSDQVPRRYAAPLHLPHEPARLAFRVPPIQDSHAHQLTTAPPLSQAPGRLQQYSEAVGRNSITDTRGNRARRCCCCCWNGKKITKFARLSPLAKSPLFRFLAS